jgi:hypothetical protein
LAFVACAFSVAGKTKVKGDSMPRDRSTIVSFHEAGHCVMAMANGFRVTELSIIGGAEGRGHTEYLIPNIPSKAERMGMVLTSVAGMAADFVHWGSNPARDAGEIAWGHFGDQRSAMNDLLDLGDSDQFDVYLGYAIRFLKIPAVWQYVLLFADLVEKVGTIGNQDVFSRALVEVPKIGPQGIEELSLFLAINRRDKVGIGMAAT